MYKNAALVVCAILLAGHFVTPLMAAEEEMPEMYIENEGAVSTKAAMSTARVRSRNNLLIGGVAAALAALLGAAIGGGGVYAYNKKYGQKPRDEGYSLATHIEEKAKLLSDPELSKLTDLSEAYLIIRGSLGVYMFKHEKVDIVYKGMKYTLTKTTPQGAEGYKLNIDGYTAAIDKIAAAIMKPVADDVKLEDVPKLEEKYKSSTTVKENNVDVVKDAEVTFTLQAVSRMAKPKEEPKPAEGNTPPTKA